jgi:hypothetical protein
MTTATYEEILAWLRVEDDRVQKGTLLVFVGRLRDYGVLPALLDHQHSWSRGHVLQIRLLDALTIYACRLVLKRGYPCPPLYQALRAKLEACPSPDLVEARRIAIELSP